MTTVITRGAGSAQALGYAGRVTAANYIEDVFSTYLYTGNGTDLSINNGIDILTKGGLVWVKGRSNAYDHYLFDTARGVSSSISSNTTGAAITTALARMLSFNTDGFTVTTDAGANSGTNNASSTFASWTFRKQAKFFDVVTYTGNGANRTIAHNLGSVPGCIMVKRTDTTAAWAVYHRSIANTEYMVLDTTAAKATGATYWNSTTPTSSVFSLGTATDVNANGGTYVAYLFAHDAGGFGASGADNVISCGSFTADGSGNATVTLGYEPQFVLLKKSSNVADWHIYDNMRGMPVGAAEPILRPNLSNAETNVTTVSPTATGFTQTGYMGAGQTAIYIAIRRGPMRTPTSGTSVFNPSYSYSVNNKIAGYLGAPSDLYIQGYRTGSANNAIVRNRLTASNYLITSSTAAEVAGSVNFWDNMLGGGNSATTGTSNTDIITWNFRRAPGFFDVVCYTGTGSTANFTHNLTVAPELMLIKRRSGVANWAVYANGIGSFTLQLNNANGKQADFNAYFANTNPTSSVFTVGSDADTNASASTYVAYLFATLAGVSKVGTYTGNGSSQTINCGFTGGSRFVLIKRYDSTGNWTVFDSARGIVAGNDPALYLNSTAAEVTTVDAVDTDNSGFIVNQETTLNLNVNAASYVFLAIA